MQLCITPAAIITVMARHKIFFSYSVPPYCKLIVVSSSDTFTSTPQALFDRVLCVVCLNCIHLCVNVEGVAIVLISISDGFAILRDILSLHPMQSKD